MEVKVGNLKLYWSLNSFSLTATVGETVNECFFQLGEQSKENCYPDVTLDYIKECKIKAIKETIELANNLTGYLDAEKSLEVVEESKPESKPEPEPEPEPKVKRARARKQPEVTFDDVVEVEVEKPTVSKGVVYTTGNEDMKQDCMKLLCDVSELGDLRKLPNVTQLVTKLRNTMLDESIIFYIDGKVTKEVKQLFMSEYRNHMLKNKAV